MPASDAYNAQMLTNKITITLTRVRERVQLFLPAQWIVLTAGIACIIYGQYLVEQRIPQGTPHPIAEFWNVKYRLEIVNYDNVLFALPYFIGGAFLCGLTAMPSIWKNGLVNWTDRWYGKGDAFPKKSSSQLIIGYLLIFFLLDQLGRHRYAPFYPFVWLAAIALLTQVFWKWDRNSKNDLAIKIHLVDLFWIFGLLTLGFAINAFALQDVPVTLVPDEGIFWETARAIAQGEIHPVFFDSGVYTFPVASSIFQSWVLQIFGTDFWAWRFASVIAAVSAVIPLYLLSKEWFGRSVAVVACLMMIANPYFVAFARLGYNNSQSLFPVTLCIYFFALAVRRGSYFYLWLAGITAGLGFYTYYATWIGLVTLCLSIFHVHFVNKLTWKRALFTFGVILAAWGCMFMPRVAYTASGSNSQGLVFKIFESSFVNTFYGKAYYAETELIRTAPLIQFDEYHSIFFEPVIYGELILRGTVRTFFSLFDPYIVFEHFLITGLAGVISPVFLLIGLSLCVREIRHLRFALPFIWLSCGMIFLSILNAFPPRHTHLVSMIPALALISGIGLIAVVERLMELVFTRGEVVRTLVKGLSITVISCAIVYFGFQRYFVRMPVTYPPQFEDVASWIAWRMESPAHLIYLGQTDAPHRVQYLVNSGIAPYAYTTKLVDEFVPQDDLRMGEPTVIFVEGNGNHEIPWVKHLSSEYHDPVSYQDQNGQIMGYAITNADIELNPKIGIDDGLHSLTSTPVRYVLMLLMVVLAASGLLILRNAKVGPMDEIYLEIGKPEPRLAEGEKDERKLPFNFHLQVRIPLRRRNRP